MSLPVLPNAFSTRIAGSIFALLCSAPALAVTEIRMAPQDAAAPKFVETNHDGKRAIGGLCVDIMREIERVEPSLKFVIDQDWQPLIRIETSMVTGKLDAACGLLRTKEFEAKFNFAEAPLFPVKYYLAVRADDDIQIRSWDDVRKLGDQGIILVVSGYGVIKNLQRLGGLTIDSSGKDSKTNIQKLLAGRGRFLYHRSPGIKSEIRNSGNADKVRLLPTVMDKEQFYMALAKTVPADVVTRVNKAIIRLENSGELKRLLDKWDQD